MEQVMTADMQIMKEEADIEVRSNRQLIRELRQDVKVVEAQREGLRELLGEVEERHANVKTKQDKVQYLKDLLLLMIVADSRRNASQEGVRFP